MPPHFSLQVWQHCDCMGVNSDVEHYLCEQCDPRPVDRVSSLLIILWSESRTLAHGISSALLPMHWCPLTSYLTSRPQFHALYTVGDNSALAFLRSVIKGKIKYLEIYERNGTIWNYCFYKYYQLSIKKVTCKVQSLNTLNIIYVTQCLREKSPGLRVNKG